MIFKTRKYVAMAAIAALFAVGCSSDDNGTTDPEETYDVIVGKWRSPVPAPLLVSFVDSIHVEFRNNQTYIVNSFKDGASVDLEGTYVTEDGVGAIRNIILEQSVPGDLTSQGIYRVSGNELTYEVAQTTPLQPGVTPPCEKQGLEALLMEPMKIGMFNIILKWTNIFK